MHVVIYTKMTDVNFVINFYKSIAIPSVASPNIGSFVQAWHLQHILGLLQ